MSDDERPGFSVVYDPSESQEPPALHLNVGDRIDLGDGREAVVTGVVPRDDGADSFRLSLPSGSDDLPPVVAS